MYSIVDYTQEQYLEHVLANDFVKRAQYLINVRCEMMDELKALDAKIDGIVQDMIDAGIIDSEDKLYK